MGGKRALRVLVAGLLAAACLSVVPGAARGDAPCAGASKQPPARTVDDPGLGVTWLADADLAAFDTFGVSGISCDGSM
jgi:hypothetical protein